MNLPPLETACAASPKFKSPTRLQISKNLVRTGYSPKSGLHFKIFQTGPVLDCKILWTEPDYRNSGLEPDYSNSGPDQKENWKLPNWIQLPPPKPKLRW